MKENYVLVLDDEENILSALKRLFLNEPFAVVTTTNPDEAFGILAQEKTIKLVISDQRMPHISGVDFLRKVKENYPDIIRILFTGYADISAVEEAINIGEVFRFINKPWNTGELKGAVHSAIQHFDLVSENKRLFEDTKTKNEELELLNRKLKAMYEIQREFSSTVSHELRTPLASIKTAIDIVMSGTPGELNEDQKNFLEKAKKNVDRLNRLINDILDLTKLESGKTILKIEFNDMNQLIQDVIGIQESVTKNKGLYLKTNLDSQIPKIPFDIDKLNQVFSNLVGNAIKFTDKGGITISAVNHPDGNHVEVCVKDTGMGIAENDIPKLFQKFQQLGDPAKRQMGGTGLGLAICKEIITQHGGKIWVESKYGQGCAFYFILPITERRKS